MRIVDCQYEIIEKKNIDSFLVIYFSCNTKKLTHAPPLNAIFSNNLSAGKFGTCHNVEKISIKFNNGISYVFIDLKIFSKFDLI